MMTGIPIENSIWSAYLLTAFLVIVGFAFYDIFHRRVPDRALVFFIPLAAAAPLIKAWFALDCGQPPLWLWPIFAKSLIGALLGFSIPLAAAMVTGGPAWAAVTSNSAVCWDSSMVLPVCPSFFWFPQYVLCPSF